MKIFPAIDLMDGKVVRLYQGDYNKQEIFGDDPLAFAKDFEAEGARYLHLVDLDGAKAGRSCNDAVVESIVKNTGLYVELGGGIRDEAAVKRFLDIGVNRVILGTAALKAPAFAKEMIERYKDKIAIGVDAREGKVAVEGWLDTSETDSYQFCEAMRDSGAQAIIYTDISKDGAGQGTNLAAYERLAELEGVEITASGGISALEDIRALKNMGIGAAILGKALYTGAIRLADALQIAE